MKATQLIGKDAIRTAPATYPNGVKDRSHMRDPIHIVKATDAHIVYFYPSGTFMAKLCGENKPHILAADWCDDNWVDYEELISIEDVPEPVVSVEFKGDASV